MVSSTEELPDLMLGTANENATTSNKIPEQSCGPTDRKKYWDQGTTA
jgi:hypothetical protein